MIVGRLLPRLLVSVRDVAEANAALAGGCDLLDVKEPRHGPLGMADLEVIAEIVALCERAPRDPENVVSSSAAFGELREWTARAPVEVPAGLRYAKLGPAGTESPGRWLAGWRQARARLIEAKDAPVEWVAVAYADWRAARSPSPRDVLEQGREVGCRTILIDTFEKDGLSLCDHLDASELAQFVDRARQLRMSVVLAGSLRSEHLPRLVRLCPDVIAVRGAVCEAGHRESAVTMDAVREFKHAIEMLFASEC